MSDLVRFGVAMDRTLLNEFDERIASKGYENRSEALRDLVRADLQRAAPEEGGAVTASLTVLCGADPRDGHPAVRRVVTTAAGVLASLCVPLGEGRSVEVLVVTGSAPALAALAGKVQATPGVLASELVVATPDGGLRRLSDGDAASQPERGSAA